MTSSIPPNKEDATGYPFEGSCERRSPKVASNTRFRPPGLRTRLFAICFGLVVQAVRTHAAAPIPGFLDTASQGGDLLPLLVEPSRSPASLDFDEIARRALARNWDDIVPKQRHEFVAVFRDLIERNYIKRVHGHPDYDLRFEREAVSNSVATVGATLEAEDHGKKVDVKLEYRLLHNGGHWWCSTSSPMIDGIYSREVVAWNGMALKKDRTVGAIPAFPRRTGRS